MIKFSELREATKGKMPPGEHVLTKKVGGSTIMIHKVDKGFAVYVDKALLDTYRSRPEAEKMATSFVKELELAK
jgi:hypothetical protein